MLNSSKLPAISIVIPSFNEENVVGKCLDSIAGLDYPKELLDVLFIDDSTDSTPEIIKRYPGIRIVNGPHRGLSAAKNLGIRNSKGEYIAFSDADCILPSSWLMNLVCEFNAPDIAGVGGIQKSPEQETNFGKSVSKVMGALGFISGYSKVKSSSADIEHNASCNVMYRKTVLMELGGFDENSWGGEDVELDYKIRKLGYRLRQNPSAAVEHFRPATLKGYNSMMRNYGAAQAFLVKKHGVFRALQTVPFIAPILLLIILSLFLSLLLTHGIGSVLLLILFILAPVVLFFGIVKSFGTDIVLYFLLFETVFLWHFGFYRYFFLKRR